MVNNGRKLRFTKGKTLLKKGQGAPDLRAKTREVAERILSLQKEGESDAEFARRIGFTPQAVYAYKKKKVGASLEAVLTVSHQTGIPPIWFIAGGDAGNSLTEGVDKVTQEMIRLVDDMRRQFGLPPASSRPAAGAPKLPDSVLEEAAKEALRQKTREEESRRNRRRGGA